MVHVIKKKHPCDGKYRLLRNNNKMLLSRKIFTLTFSRLKGIIKMKTLNFKIFLHFVNISLGGKSIDSRGQARFLVEEDPDLLPLFPY